MTTATLACVATSGLFAFPVEVQGFALGLGSTTIPRAGLCVGGNGCVQHGLRKRKGMFAAADYRMSSSSINYNSDNRRRISVRKAAKGDSALAGASDNDLSSSRERELSHEESDRMRASDREGEVEQSDEEVARMLAAHRAECGLPQHLAIIMDGKFA